MICFVIDSFDGVTRDTRLNLWITVWTKHGELISRVIETQFFFRAKKLINTIKSRTYSSSSHHLRSLIIMLMKITRWILTVMNIKVFFFLRARKKNKIHPMDFPMELLEVLLKFDINEILTLKIVTERIQKKRKKKTGRIVVSRRN